MEGGGATSSRKRQLDHDVEEVEEITANRLTLCIKSQDGLKRHYKIMPDLKIQKLFSNYCKDRNVEYGTFAFLFDGRQVKTTKTPSQLGLKDGDTIDAMGHHDGGGYACICLPI